MILPILMRFIRLTLLVNLFLVPSCATALLNPFTRLEEIRQLSILIDDKEAELQSAQLAAYQSGPIGTIMASPLGKLYTYAMHEGIMATIYLSGYAYAKKLNLRAHKLMVLIREKWFAESSDSKMTEQQEIDAHITNEQCNHIMCDVKKVATVSVGLIAGAAAVWLKKGYDVYASTATLRAEIAELRRKKNLLMMIR